MAAKVLVTPFRFCIHGNRAAASHPAYSLVASLAGQGQVLFLESVAGAEDDFTDWFQPRTLAFP